MAWRALLLCSLYFSQGLPFGFFSQTLPVLLRQSDVSLLGIGFSYLLVLPWCARFLWAPLVDRIGRPSLGLRRSWLLPLQLAGALLCFALVLIADSGALWLLAGATFLFNVIGATQDIASDGLAADILRPKERQLGNSLQFASDRIGMLVGGGLLVIVFDQFGARTAFAILGALIAAATLPIALHREQNTEPVSAKRPRGFFQRPRAWALLGFIALYKFGDIAFFAMLRPFLVDRGLGLSEIARVLGIYGVLSAIAGSLLAAVVFSATQRTRGLFLCALLQALSILPFVAALPGTFSTPLLFALILLQQLTSGLATAVLLAYMMDHCAPGRRATDYALQVSVLNIAGVVAHLAAGGAADAMGYRGVFALAGVLAGLAALASRQLSAREPVATRHTDKG